MAGRHRPAKGTTTSGGRRVIADPVPAAYLLTPAAYQLVTRTRDLVPAGPGEHTGLLLVRPVRCTNAWTVPSPHQTGVIAAALADLAGPAAHRITSDLTTDTTSTGGTTP